MEQTSSQVISTNASILNSTTLLATPSHPNKVDAKKVALIGKIPVVISEADVQVYVDATIQLEEQALEITNVKNNVFLTSCQLLMTDDKKSAKLLISGFMRKNIQYSSAKHIANTALSGKSRFTSVNVPFKCFTKVDFLTEPVTSPNPQVITSSDVAYDGMRGDEYSERFTDSEILNEKIYCELLEAKIRDIDVKKDGEHITYSYGTDMYENVFNTIIETSIIELKIRILQRQNAHIIPGAKEKANLNK